MPRIKIEISTPVMSLFREMTVVLPANRDFVLEKPDNCGIPLSGAEQASRAAALLFELLSNNPRDEDLRYMLKCVDEAISSHTSAIRAECIRRMNQQATLPMSFNFNLERLENTYGQ